MMMKVKFLLSSVVVGFIFHSFCYQHSIDILFLLRFNDLRASFRFISLNLNIGFLSCLTMLLTIDFFACLMIRR